MSDKRKHKKGARNVPTTNVSPTTPAQNASVPVTGKTTGLPEDPVQRFEAYLLRSTPSQWQDDSMRVRPRKKSVILPAKTLAIPNISVAEKNQLDRSNAARIYAERNRIPDEDRVSVIQTDYNMSTEEYFVTVPENFFNTVLREKREQHSWQQDRDTGR